MCGATVTRWFVRVSVVDSRSSLKRDQALELPQAQTGQDGSESRARGLVFDPFRRRHPSVIKFDEARQESQVPSMFAPSACRLSYSERVRSVGSVTWTHWRDTHPPTRSLGRACNSSCHASATQEDLLESLQSSQTTRRCQRLSNNSCLIN